MTKRRTQVTIDRKKCMGYGNCVATAPDLFDLDDDGIAVVLESGPDTTGKDDLAKRAARACPVHAISTSEIEPS